MRSRQRTSALGAALLIVAAALLSACSSPQPAANANRPAPAPTSEPAPPPDPETPEHVNFTTDDGVLVEADLYLPEKTPAPALLALHQWNSDRTAWRDFARAMRGAGFVVLAIDARGFGGSKKSSEGDLQPDRNTQADVDAAVDYLKAQPPVDALRIGIVGASYGASNALVYAADHPETVRSTALLSIGIDYVPSIDVSAAAKRYGDRPLLYVAARDDAESAADTEKLAAAKGPRHRLKIFDTGGHGTALLAPSAGGIELLRDFFVETLTGPIVTRGGEGNVDAEGGGASPESGENRNDNSKGDRQ